MKGTTLEFAQENYSFRLKGHLNRIAAKPASPGSYFMVGLSHRILGICALLHDADADAFAARLGKSGQVRLYFLQQIAAGLSVPPKYVCCSKNIGFTSALAAADLDVARDIARLSPTSHFADVEYEDDFCFFHFLHRILLDPNDIHALEGILLRWETVLEGQDSGYFDACKGLYSADPDEFEAGLDALIEHRKRQLERYQETVSFDAETYAAEGHVFIEGLAVLQIAQMKGLPTRPDYELMPSLARIPLGTPPQAPDAWRQPD